MKKLTYLLGLMLIGGLIFTSCSDDDDVEPADLSPTIAFTLGGNDTTVTLGDVIEFGVACTSNPTSGEKLDSYEVYMIVDDVNTGTLYDSLDINNNAFAINNLIPTGLSPDPFEGKVYAKITDKDGESNEVYFTLTVEAGTTDLEGEEDLEWQRVAGAAGTGLDMFGLKWTSNIKEVMAVIQKDSADKLVQLGAAAWTTITTKEELMAVVETAEDLGDEGYRGVSAEADGTYDDVLATKFNGEYFLIHITEGTVVVDPVNGTTITINGMYNK